MTESTGPNAASLAQERKGDYEVVQSTHSGDFLRLCKLWERRTHFSLVFAVVDNPDYRDMLIGRLNGMRVAERLDLQAGSTPLDWLARLESLGLAGATRAHVCLPTDARLPPRWWQEANVLRERIADALPGLLVMWLGDAELDALAHEAPDLWNWREAVCSFSLSVAPSALPLPWLEGERFAPMADVERAQVEQRLRRIAEYLGQQTSEDSSSAFLHLEAAQAYERLGQWEESDRAARTAARQFALAGDASLAAQAKGKIADILQARGRLDEALAIRQDEELPVYERLGDVRSAAITKGKIADILQARGRLDEALALWRDQVLPVIERIGSPDELAFVKTRIAELSQALSLPGGRSNPK